MNEKIQGMIKAIRDWADEKFQLKGDYAAESDIPTLTSQLTNNSGFVTNIVDSLVNYYKKSETYTKDEVATLIAGINTMQFLVVTALPTENISTSTIYLVPAEDGKTGNVYNEYLYVNGQWEVIGNTAIDLSGYLTTTGDSSATVSSGDIEAGDSIDIAFDEEDYPVLIINSTEKLRVKFRKISDCFNELVSTIKSKIASQNDDFANSLAQINSDLQTYELIWSVEKGYGWATLPEKKVSDYKFVICAITSKDTIRTCTMIPAKLLTLNSASYPLHVHFTYENHDDIAFFAGASNLFSIYTQRIVSNGYSAAIYGIK